MAHLAFYKGRGTFLDWLIRTVTRSQYSHVEYVEGPWRPERPGADYRARRASVCWSSSPRDGGVRRAIIDLDPAKWDLVEIGFEPDSCVPFFQERICRPYDTVGVLLSQFFSFRRQNPEKWFCSEICAAALGLPAPETFSPATLKLAVETLNDVFDLGVEVGAASAGADIIRLGEV